MVEGATSSMILPDFRDNFLEIVSKYDVHTIDIARDRWRISTATSKSLLSNSEKCET
jgi:hypothetical protein